jgi:hypothetical protein
MSEIFDISYNDSGFINYNISNSILKYKQQ